MIRRSPIPSLLSADEICEPYGLGEESRIILGNFIAWLIKNAKHSPDADSYGAALVEYIEKSK